MPNRKARAVKRPHFIKEWRLYRGYTQERLAGLVDMGAPSISQLENAKQGYTEETLAKLADALQCAPADLLGRDPNKPVDYLIRIVTGLTPDEQERAVRVIEAMTGKAA